MVHRTTGTQTEADDSTETGNKQATTSIVPQRKRAVGLQIRPIIYWKYVLPHAKKQRQFRLSHRRHPSVFQKQTTRVSEVCYLKTFPKLAFARSNNFQYCDFPQIR